MAGKLRIKPITRARLKREAERARDPLAASDYRNMFQGCVEIELDDSLLGQMFVESTPKRPTSPVASL